MAESDAQKLLADGQEILLADGTTHHLVFDIEGMMDIEARYGSLFAYSKEINASWDAAIATNVYRGIVAMLRHERGEYPLAEKPPLDRKQLSKYRAAIVRAFNEALPDTEGKVPARTGRSRGGASTASPSSTSDAVSASSAA